MDKYISRWKDRDMRGLVETNKLYEIVKYYGGYLHYCRTPKTEEKTYAEFYKNNNKRMEKIFINNANANAKKYFNRYGITGTRMRQMLITKGGKRVRAYEWLFEYVEYILKQSMENSELKEEVLQILQKDCDYCFGKKNLMEWKILCAKRLLGFQYMLLQEVGERKVKVSESALNNICAVENSNLIERIIENCPTIINSVERR